MRGILTEIDDKKPTVKKNIEIENQSVESQENVICTLIETNINEIIHYYHRAAKKSAVYYILKRVLDIIIGSALLFIMMPFLILIAFLIKLESRGPVVIKQHRVGRNRRLGLRSNGHLVERRKHDLKGQLITIYKFRTMYDGVNMYADSPSNTNDPRITRVGKFIRSLCLDELPQIINIIRGDISLVGPRPEMPYIVRNYNEIQSLRLIVKPGLTGLWQIKAPRDKHIHEYIHFDLDYILFQSTIFDMKLIFKTIYFICHCKNI